MEVFSIKNSRLKRFTKRALRLGALISPYLGFLFTIIFLLPWINGNLRLHNSNEILSLIEIFVLSSATLSLVTFTYIAAVRDLDEKVRSSMVIAGEDFIVSTVQFIVGLGIFLGVNLIFSHFINEADWSNLNLIPIFILEIIQVIGIYEVATALSKFLKGIIEVYKTFKTRSQLYRIYKMLIK